MPEKKKTIRVLVADDHFAIRMGLITSVNAEDDMEVVAESNTGEQTLERYREHLPDVVLMDMKMPGTSGVEATQAIRREFPEARIVIFSAFAGDESIYQALKAGAYAYVLKSSPREELLKAIRSVHRAERYLPPEVAASLAKRISLEDLTERELSVLQGIVAGLSNKEIGARIHLSEATVKAHVGSLLSKLEVADRTQAALSALQRGLVHLD